MRTATLLLASVLLAGVGACKNDAATSNDMARDPAATPSTTAGSVGATTPGSPTSAATPADQPLATPKASTDGTGGTTIGTDPTNPKAKTPARQRGMRARTGVDGQKDDTTTQKKTDSTSDSTSTTK